MRYKVLCGYIRQRWDCGDTVEIEEKHTGKYGARGQTREKKRKATPEEIKKHNQWKRERDVRRLIKWNFRERDYWITLTYPKDYRPTWEEMKDHAGKLVRKMREKYKKQGWTLKYIYRLAIGSRGGRHIHILINRESNEKTATDLIITDLWEQQWGHGHTIKIDASDNDGNAATQKSVTFKVDTVPPTLSVTSPADGLVTNQAALTVKGTTNDATSSPVKVTIKLNSGVAESVTVGSDGNFSKALTLVAGTNTITVVATDSAGKTTTVTRTVKLDTSAPVIKSVTLNPNPVDAGKTFIISVEVVD